VPLVPAFVAGLIRPLFMRAFIGDMEEPRRKSRASELVRNADPWKWKKAARAARDFELQGTISGIPNEVFVLNGTRDGIHDQTHCP